MWVFSATDTDKKGYEGSNTDEGAWSDTYEGDENTWEDNASGNTNNADTSGTTISGSGALTVVDQSAGGEVVVASVVYPQNDGWIVVHEQIAGTRANVLGAARFDVAGGLTPTSVELLRNTEVGGAYEVLFYTENGDKAFDMTNDIALEGSTVVFSATE